MRKETCRNCAVYPCVFAKYWERFGEVCCYYKPKEAEK